MMPDMDYDDPILGRLRAEEEAMRSVEEPCLPDDPRFRAWLSAVARVLTVSPLEVVEAAGDATTLYRTGMSPAEAADYIRQNA